MEHWGYLIGAVSSVFTILAVMIGMFLHLETKIDNFRNDMSQQTKDFHGRLCAIEERNKK